MTNDHYFMKLALDLASTAKGKTNPNPLVGAVIVKDGMIVGSGLHRKAGEPHAEVHAFHMAGDHARGATLYVTLEPCSHFGKTPPCANLVKESGVSRVVIAMRDPNPLVAGRGIKILEDAGIEVEVGVLEQEARRLNERFIHNMLTQMPFVISKVAMTLDGKIAAYNGDSKWVSGEASRQKVHYLRNEVDAILVGIGTVLADDPMLTTRIPEGGKNPIRIIIDSGLRTPLEAKITDCSEAETWIFTHEGVDEEKEAALLAKGVQVYAAPQGEGLDLTFILKQLYELGITDLLVEGGGEVNSAFLREGLINKFQVYIAPKVLGGRHSLTPFTGKDVETMAEAVELEFDSVEHIGEDLLITAYPKQQTES
ncbi:bifunctional diaminohydroxyphosphoribosylaminopyrimidine deaminase/5-amino-6-(5-phosphoribosylamino)uracil reductase RibD [Niallia endozanthoxylica]|uniref:Riboflavin biosynthesis protein RibD n=1 Tax=Niallia endozanthoxylica TaxID=2036016 RepID=A0A5J5HGG0_9BACI|nr:bifunctional diaminohydroxyphosphoribosylaminopyrimidine deaminase/5-amino-6-(5-phosphoribosylamino)uracil reductase RibD [Niallia endozanthoxylica]KAA9019936.1 bifunctional diaminohydroxyphosphoribosylaminopyrimidine deaminase/5-amino-6-(5-phosphoribosylamino)uracil reductase RibD [Niallia endozanthoxylica]